MGVKTGFLKPANKKELAELDLEDKKKFVARRKSIKEGIFASMQNAFGNNFISPFAIAINASNSLIAMLSSISGILGPLSQVFGSSLLKKYSRKKITINSVFLQALTWIPLILIALLYSFGFITNFLPLVLFLVFGFFTIFSNLASPAWFSWMGDLVDDSYRGRWFAKRNFITGFISVVLAIASSYFLDYFNSIGKQIYGFMILFFLAGCARFYSGFCFKQQYEPKIIIKEEDHIPFSDFILNLKKDNFGRFAFFRALLAFACSISAPLVAIYLIKELNFSYFVYMILIMSGTIYSLIFIEFWGKFSDKYGNFRTIAITSVFIPLVPILWVIYPNPLFLLFIASLVNGFAWSGFDLASSNFIYDNLSPGKRAQLLSYFHVLIGIGTFVGASISAILIKYLPLNFIIQPIIFIFFLGSLVRMIVIYFFMGNLNEIRKTKRFTGANVFKRMFLKESFSTLKHEANHIMDIPRYVFENDE